MLLPLLPLFLLALLLPVFLWAEYKSPSKWKKLGLKTVCSLLFMTAAVLSALLAPNGWHKWSGVFLAAFGLSVAGDVLLSFPMKHSFQAGLGAFFLAQCSFVAAFLSRYYLSPWDALLFAVLAGAVLFTLLKAPGMEYGKMRFPVILYALAVSAMASKAVSGVWLIGGPAAWVAAAGGALFFASDVILAFVIFSRKKPASLRALNLISYYAGQALLAVSLYL